MALARRGFLGALAGLAATAASSGTAVAQPAPDPVAALWMGMELQGQDGRSFNVRDLRAPVTLLHLWANWCPACLGEMGSLATAAAAMGDKVDVVFVSHPQFWHADQAFAGRRNLPFRLATPTTANGQPVLDAALLENGAYAVPRTVLLRADGRNAAWSHLGAVSWSSPGAVARLRTVAAS